LDDQLAAVKGAVVSRAKRDEIFGSVSPALGARTDVVHVDVNGVPATRNSAAAAVATEDLAAHGGRDGLGGTRFWRPAFNTACMVPDPGCRTSNAHVGAFAGQVALGSSSLRSQLGDVVANFADFSAAVVRSAHVSAVIERVLLVRSAHESAVIERVLLVRSAHVSAVIERVLIGSVMHVSDVLSIASDHRGNFVSDLDELSAPLLLRSAATLADRESKLITGAPFIARPSEDVPRQEQ
jgi:hypothetical protein